MSININKETQFFISINKQDVHSFVMLGTYKKNKIGHLLCRVGKVADLSDKERKKTCSMFQNTCNTLFSHINAKLYDEGLGRKEIGSKPITYQAYDITYEQYLEFVKILETIQTETNKYKCYKPLTEKDNVTLNLTDQIVLTSKPEKKIKNNACELSITNTCRHTAIDLIEQTKHSPVSSMITNNFISSLPYQTVLDYGRPSKRIPFYVLPFPPSTFPKMEKIKLQVITKLYSRMENILLLNCTSGSTSIKFLKLKELYLQIIGPQKEVSLEELLKSVQNWKKENSANLGVLRKTYFWDKFFTRTSATTKLIDEVERDLHAQLP